MDHNENVLGELTNDISTENSGSISVNYQQGIRRSCSLTLIDIDGVFIPNGNPVTWANRKFKIYIGLSIYKFYRSNNPLIWSYDPNDYILYYNEENDKIVSSNSTYKILREEDIYWFSQGIFFVTNISSSRTGSSRTVTLEGVDKFGLFGTETGYGQLQSDMLIKQGTNVHRAIRDILLLELGNGYVFDPIDPILDMQFKDEILPYDIKKSPDQTISDLLIELANVLGCNLFYDTEGHLNLQSGTTDLSYSSYASIWEFSDTETEYLDSGVSYDQVNTVNIVKVIGTNTEDTIYEYTATNQNPASPTRVDLIGKKFKQIETPMAYNEDRAKEYSEFMLNRLSILQKIINFSMPFVPHLDVDKVILISDSYFNYNQERFIIQSLNIPLESNSLMSCSACNVASLPYYDHQNA